MKTIFPYLLQDKTPAEKRFSTVYGFALGSQIKKNFEEYKNYWSERHVRVVKNPKYTKKTIIEVPEKYRVGY